MSGPEPAFNWGSSEGKQPEGVIPGETYPEFVARVGRWMEAKALELQAKEATTNEEERGGLMRPADVPAGFFVEGLDLFGLPQALWPVAAPEIQANGTVMLRTPNGRMARFYAPSDRVMTMAPEDVADAKEGGR